MKRGRDKVQTKTKKKGQDVFGEANNTVDFDSDEDTQESEEELKRNKLIRLRHSFIENDKAGRGQKRQKSNSDGSPVRQSRKKVTKDGGPRKSEVNFDASAYFSSDVENVDTDNENRENRDTGGKGKRFRRRLSKKLRDEGRTSTGALNISYGNLNTTVHSPNNVSPTRTPTDTKTLREIYSTCSALFQAHKITPQNAFSLKLVECIDEIIQSDDFDKQNLPLLARTLEISGKIYVCRVDFSHTHTVKLASEIASNQKATNDNDEEGQDEAAAQDIAGEEEAEQEKGKKKTRARNKKRSRFIETEESKLNTRFEDQSSKYVTRRTSLKAKLHRNIDEELEFDYLSFFVKSGELHPLEREEVSKGLDCLARIPPSHVNEIDMKQLNFLPFNFLSNWNSSKYDIWGQPKDNALDASIPQSQPESQPEIVDEFAYNPETRPDEYPEPMANLDGEPMQDDFQGGDFDMSRNMDDGNQMDGTQRPLSLDALRSLKDLHQYFTSLKGIQLNMKNKYGWAGPIFLKPQRLELKKRPDGTVKKRRKVKQEMVLDYDEVDWKDPANRYVEGTASKLILDDKSLAKWAVTKTSMPYCSSHNFLDYEEDEEDYNDPFVSEDCQEDEISNIVRFFTDTNRNIFKLMEEEFKEGKDVLSQSMVVAREENTSENSMEIEAPRDYNDDSGGHDQGEPALDAQQFPDPYASLLSMLPASAGFGIDTEDPMSKVSEIDSIKFSKQPKPIDMHELKKVILDVLTIKLALNDDGRTTSPQDTITDLLSVICETMKRVSSRMLRHMTISIIVVGLMHVVADKRLFMTPGDHDGNPQIICRGSNWIHKHHIPMGRVAFDF